MKEFILIALVLLGSLNWGLIGLFNFNLVKSFGSLFGQNLQNPITRIIYIIISIAGLVLSAQRDTYLPFLGRTVMPQPLIEYKPSGKLKIKVITNLPPNVKVIYWVAHQSNKVVDNPYDAYGDYSNHGVTKTDENGKAILQFLIPSSYRVPYKGTLTPHIHYRYWNSSGMASRVFTEDIL
jgi:uncharacterized membrane protein YuzA (DUF378 family)